MEIQVNEIRGEGLTAMQFEKVYVINLPTRGDKRDAITLAASLTGFEFDIIEGLDGKDIPDKALPGVCAPLLCDQLSFQINGLPPSRHLSPRSSHHASILLPPSSSFKPY